MRGSIDAEGVFHLSLWRFRRDAGSCRRCWFFQLLVGRGRCPPGRYPALVWLTRLCPVFDLKHVILHTIPQTVRIAARILQSKYQYRKHKQVLLERTFWSTTRSVIDVILATIHSRVLSCSARWPVACRK